MYPVLFQLGPITIYSYGFFVAVAIILVSFLLYRESKRRDFYTDKILDLEFYAIVSGLIGARFLHVLVNLDFYKENPLEILFLWKGGLAFYGGLFFGIGAAFVFILKNRLPTCKIADFFIPYLALAQSVGRIGCFLNGCCFGKAAELPLLGVIFSGDEIYRHPTQIYASLALLGIFVILRLAQRKRFFDGAIFLLYFALYSLQRFFLDFLRGDNPTYIVGLTVSQIISLFIVSTLLLWFIKYGKNKIYR